MKTDKAIVAVAPRPAREQRPRLFRALEAAFEVRFVDFGAVAHPDAVLWLDDAGPPDRLFPAAPMLVMGGGSSRERPRARVNIGSHMFVDRRVRGIVVKESLGGPALEPLGEGEDVLAHSNAVAVWKRTRGPGPVHRVCASLPELGESEVLYGLLSRRPLATIALVQFLRQLDAVRTWEPPPLRASIVFDDPNLRWRSYGYIDYRRLVEHADRHGYHASMAMIPLDAGRAHGPTVSLFQRRADRLSLVVHGNDHRKTEFMEPPDTAAAFALTAQALRRTVDFERRSGLAVDRVMMPPHGLCSRRVTRALGSMGFDALCAIHPLPWTQRPPENPPLAGWRPAEFVDGCAVVPRIPLSSSSVDIALRAFLDHPVVLYGHHEDLARGLEPLAESAAVINGMGDAQWMSPGDIALTNHSVRRTENMIAVRPFSRRVRVAATPAATRIQVAVPDDTFQAEALAGWSLNSGSIRAFGTCAPLSGANTVEIRLHSHGDRDPSGVAIPAWRPWPIVRRSVTELRDRVRPLL